MNNNKFVILTITFALAILCRAEVLNNKIFSLNHIDADKAIAVLDELGIGQTVNKVKNVNAIIITAGDKDLIKAKAVIDLIDSKTTYKFDYIEQNISDFAPEILDKLSKKLKDTSFGTFTEPVGKSNPHRVLIDLHNDKLLVATAPEQTDEVVNAINNLLSPAPKEPLENLQQLAEPNVLADVNIPMEQPEQDANTAEIDDMFGDMLKALEQAETTKTAEQQIAEEAAVESEVIEQPADDINETEAQNQQMLFDMLEKLAPAQEEKKAAEPNEPAAANMQQQKTQLAEPIIPDANTVLELALPERVDIINLLDLLGEYLGVDYIYNAAQIQGDTMLKVQGAITVGDLYAYVEAILKSRGFAMVRGRGKLVMIMPAAEAINYDPTIVGSDREVKAGNVFVSNVFELNFVDTASVQKLLTEMKLGASIVAIPEIQTIIITDYAYRMQRIEDLIKLIDKPGETKTIKFRQIQYVTVTSLIPKLEKLAQQLGSVTISTTVSAAAPAQPAARVRRPARPAAPAQPGQPAAAEKADVLLEADERTNRIIMIGTDEQLKLVNELIDSLDIRQQDLRQIKNYEIDNLAAEEVAKKLQELGLTANSVSTSTNKFTAKPPTQPGQPAAAGQAASEEAVSELATVVLLEATNSLLINATPEQHEQIQMIIAFVDRAPSEASVPYVVYPLEYQKPIDLADVLTQIIEKTVSVKDEKDKVVKAPTTEEQDITIVPDENAFSIIVYASRKNQEWIGKLIRSLDQKRPQVLIDVMLVEITNDDGFTYSLDIVQSFPDLSEMSGYTGLFAKAETSSYQTTGKLPTTKDRYIDIGMNSGDGTAFYADKHINALLNIVQSNNYGRVLAKPKILVNDNQPGIIDTTTTTYVEEKSLTYPSENSTPVESSTYKAYDAGIKLEITPHISEGNLLLLEINLERSDFLKKTSEQSASAPPNTVKTSVETFVTVPDQKTIILGGLLKLNQSKGASKVPLLGDIPLVGLLFRGASNSDIQSKLYVFVKAQISRPREDIEGLPELVSISKEHEDEFNKEEEKFQKYQELPGVPFAPMEPVKVLEAK